jgi:hypothetical protein
MSTRKNHARHHAPSLVGTVAKWVALSVTSGAAMVSFMSDSDSIGLFGWMASEGMSLSDYAVRSIRLTPRADTAFAIGDSIHLAATVTDKRGSTIIGASVMWRSLDHAVAAVDSSGVAVVRGPGKVGIVAEVREYSDTAWVIASQRLAGVKIDVDSIFSIPEQESRPIFAMAVDSRRHEILGLRPRWTSSDHGVLTIDSLGTATGIAPGKAIVTATLAEMRSEKTIRVVPAAEQIALVGSEQRAAAGQRLDRPVVVKVWSRGGTPLEKAVVRFYPLSGSGSVEHEEVVTDGTGVARTRWTLGPTPGRHEIRISVEGADSTLMVYAEADPHSGDIEIASLHDSLVARFGTTLTDTLTIEATDSLGRILPNIPVTWSTRDGGTIDAIDGRTDTLGRARARWTLGDRAGWQHAEAAVGNPRTVPPHTIEAWAEPGRVSRAEIVSGKGQHATVGKGLSKAIVVRALDEHDNPVPGVVVTVDPGQSSVPETELTTDVNGQVAVPWTLGRRSGNQRLAIRVAGVKAPLVAVATAEPRGAGNIEFVAPPTGGSAGKPLAKRMVVLVTDAYGNPVADKQVFFSGPAGIVNPQRAMTGDDGRASTKWTLGNKTGRSWLQATVSGTKLKAVMKVDVN